MSCRRFRRNQNIHPRETSLLNCVLDVLCVFTCLRAHVLCVLPCLGPYVLGVLTCLACLACLRAWRVYVLSVLACLRVWCAYYDEMFIFLRVCVLGEPFCLICFTFQYLDLKILRAKNLCALLSWTYFLFTFWYQLIQIYETN